MKFRAHVRTMLLSMTGVMLVVMGVVHGTTLMDVPPLHAQSIGVGPSVQGVPLVFIGVTVIDVQTGERHPAQRVIIIGNHITAVGAAKTIRIPAGARVVDARGKYLIPGLWDMHTHSNHIANIFYPLFIANGVTGIRDAGSAVPLDSQQLWRREILAGTRVGPPRQILDGPAIDDGQCNPEPWDYHTCVSGPAGGRAIVDSLKAAGADMIKTYGLSDSTYFAIAAETRRVGIPFGGHRKVPDMTASDSGARILDHFGFPRWDLGKQCWSQEASEARCREVAEHFRRNQTWWVPTFFVLSYADRLLPYMKFGGLAVPEDVLDDASPDTRITVDSPTSELLKRIDPFAQTFWNGAPFHPAQVHDLIAPLFTDSAHTTSPPTQSMLAFVRQVGIPILAGTDVVGFPLVNAPVARGFSLPGFILHVELAFEVAKGLTPLEVLQTATLNPATMLHATDSLGTVTPGHLADLVLLDADPLMNISNITLIRGVVANGRYFDRTALDQLIATAQTDAKREHIPLIDSTLAVKSNRSQ